MHLLRRHRSILVYKAVTGTCVCINSAKQNVSCHQLVTSYVNLVIPTAIYHCNCRWNKNVRRSVLPTHRHCDCYSFTVSLKILFSTHPSCSPSQTLLPIYLGSRPVLRSLCWEVFFGIFSSDCSYRHFMYLFLSLEGFTVILLSERLTFLLFLS